MDEECFLPNPCTPFYMFSSASLDNYERYLKKKITKYVIKIVKDWSQLGLIEKFPSELDFLW